MRVERGILGVLCLSLKFNFIVLNIVFQYQTAPCTKFCDGLGLGIF